MERHSECFIRKRHKCMARIRSGTYRKRYYYIIFIFLAALLCSHCLPPPSSLPHCLHNCLPNSVWYGVRWRVCQYTVYGSVWHTMTPEKPNRNICPNTWIGIKLLIRPNIYSVPILCVHFLLSNFSIKRLLDLIIASK